MKRGKKKIKYRNEVIFDRETHCERYTTDIVLSHRLRVAFPLALAYTTGTGPLSDSIHFKLQTFL